MIESANEAKKQIRTLSKEFNLKFNPEWFEMIWIPKRIAVLTEYLGDCPDPIYNKYGKNPKERIENVDMFVNSNDFKKCLKRYGGQVSSKKDWNKELKWIKKIKDNQIKTELLIFQKKLKKHFKHCNYITLLTIPKNKKEREWQLKWCLRHEWIHILLDNNKIQFQEINKKFFAYDEGINYYMGAFLDNELELLEKLMWKEHYPLEKKGWEYAIRFRKLLKDQTSPIGRKKAIISLIEKLKVLTLNK